MTVGRCDEQNILLGVLCVNSETPEQLSKTPMIITPDPSRLEAPTPPYEGAFGIERERVGGVRIRFPWFGQTLMVNTLCCFFFSPADGGCLLT